MSAQLKPIDAVANDTGEVDPAANDPNSPDKAASVPAESTAAAPESSTDPVESASPATVPGNPVGRIVSEVCALMGDVHHIREDLLARGVQFHTVNLLVETGQHDKRDEQVEMMDKAIAMSQKAHGSAAVTREALEESIATLVALEKDIGHVRRLAREQDMDMHALNFLTQLIRLNPGDGGEKAVNTLVAYAISCDIKLERFQEVTQAIIAGTVTGGKSTSVLPQIERPVVDERSESIKQLVRDSIVGLLIGVGVMWLLL